MHSEWEKTASLAVEAVIRKASEYVHQEAVVKKAVTKKTEPEADTVHIPSDLTLREFSASKIDSFKIVNITTDGEPLYAFLLSSRACMDYAWKFRLPQPVPQSVVLESRSLTQREFLWLNLHQKDVQDYNQKVTLPKLASKMGKVRHEQPSPLYLLPLRSLGISDEGEVSERCREWIQAAENMQNFQASPEWLASAACLWLTLCDLEALMKQSPLCVEPNPFKLGVALSAGKLDVLLGTEQMESVHHIQHTKDLFEVLRLLGKVTRNVLLATDLFLEHPKEDQQQLKKRIEEKTEEVDFAALLSRHHILGAASNVCASVAGLQATAEHKHSSVLDALFGVFYDAPAGGFASISQLWHCLLYTSPSPRDKRQSRMPSSA